MSLVGTSILYNVTTTVLIQQQQQMAITFNLAFIRTSLRGNKKLGSR